MGFPLQGRRPAARRRLETAKPLAAAFTSGATDPGAVALFNASDDTNRNRVGIEPEASRLSTNRHERRSDYRRRSSRRSASGPRGGCGTPATRFAYFCGGFLAALADILKNRQGHTEHFDVLSAAQLPLDAVGAHDLPGIVTDPAQSAADHLFTQQLTRHGARGYA
jgi:hypothetical protein